MKNNLIIIVFLFVGFAAKAQMDMNMPGMKIDYRLFQSLHTDVTLGVQGTLNIIPQGLNKLYGSSPLSAEVYLKISPSLIKMMKM